MSIKNLIFFVPNFGEWVELLLCEVPGSNISLYPEWEMFHGFIQSVQMDFVIVCQSSSCLLHFIFIQVHYSQKYYSVQCIIIKLSVLQKKKDKSGRLFPNMHMQWLKLIFIEVLSAASDVFYRDFFNMGMGRTEHVECGIMHVY